MKEREGANPHASHNAMLQSYIYKVSTSPVFAFYRCAFLPLPSKLRCNKSRCKQRANKIANIA